MAEFIKKSLDQAQGMSWSVFVGDDNFDGDFEHENFKLIELKYEETRFLMFRAPIEEKLIW